jgi:hypothetical protein
MNPILRYTFKSRKNEGTTLTIRSRLGIDSARSAAMIALWGPLPDPVVPTRFGLGLDLLSVEEPND